MIRSKSAAALLAIFLGAAGVIAQPPSPAAPPIPPPVPPTAPGTALPDAASLFEEYVKAIGGIDAIKRHTSIKYVGTIKIPSLNYSAFLTLWQAAPRSLVMYIEPPGAARASQFCDGERSWGYDAPPAGTGWRFFDGAQHADMVFSSDFYADSDYKARYSEIKTVEVTDFNGRDAYKVLTKCADGREQFLFFDIETSLILGAHTVQDEDGRLIPLIVINSDYKEVDGVKYITGQTHRTPGRDIVFLYRVIEPNPKDMPSLELPDELKSAAPAPGAASLEPK
jgi:hypothetical protein